MTDASTPAADPIVSDIQVPEIGDMNLFDIFGTDVSSEEDGRWFIDYFGDRGKGDVCLRGFMSKPSLAARRKIEAAYRRFQRNDGTWPTEVAQRMVTEQLATAIIVNWRGSVFRNPDGSPIAFSPEMAKMLMEKLPHLRNRFVATAGELDNFRAEAQGAIEKN